MVRETGSTSRIYKGIFWIVRQQGMKLVNQTFELIPILLRGVVLEPNGSGFDVRQRVIVRSAALHLHVIGVRGRLLQ